MSRTQRAPTGGAQKSPKKSAETNSTDADKTSVGEESASDSSSTPQSVARTLTPMLRHYLEVKSQYSDAILLYRMGDFYELFFDDAVEAAPVLEVALTARQKGTPSEAPMCGVPHHAIEGYIGKLLTAGYKVAVCDQVEDPAEAKGLVRREVTRVVTPGTISEMELLTGKEANLLGSIAFESALPNVSGETPNGAGALALLDVSTGHFVAQAFGDESTLIDQLRIHRPREVLFESGTVSPRLEASLEELHVCSTGLEGGLMERGDAARQRLLQQFEVESLRGYGLIEDGALLRAAAWALRYATDSAMRPLGHIRSLEVRLDNDFLTLDETTLRNLEVFENQRDATSRATLIAVCDRTTTSGGGRKLRDWLRHPLRTRTDIMLRQECVEELLGRADLRGRCSTQLSEIGDLERLATRAVLGRLNPREASIVRHSLLAVPELQRLMVDVQSEILLSIARADPLVELAEQLDSALVDSPPATLKDGGVIREGFDGALDEVRGVAGNAKQLLLELEGREREGTGISNLKVRFNRVFGYYIEVTKSNQGRVPEHYIRKQTLANAERYFTDELKELEEKILGAEAEQMKLEEALFEEVKSTIAASAVALRELYDDLSTLDVLLSFAELAHSRAYCRPALQPAGGSIEIQDGRHPVVESLTSGEFVPNDVLLDPEGSQIVLLTGPNMGGKSTYLRQVAHIVLLAQVGSFVPARSASISVVDRIFTRVGASDDLARGESTFMVEMIETANILRHASRDSLVILDEVGRGTATFDGLSLAWAIVEYLHTERRPKTLFATHYHELTELSSLLPQVVNRTMAVKEWHEQIVFLHRVIDGAADKSYGIQVARLAGLPESVLLRAGEVLQNLEEQEYDFSGRPRLARGDSAPPSLGPDQLGLFAAQDEVVVQLLKEVDLDRLTPLAALNLLATLKERLG